MTHTIESISNDSRSMNETNDCTVRALVATTGKSYAECHAALKAHGRRNRCGAWRRQWEKAANDLGFKLINVNLPGRTIRTATRSLPRGRKFILQVRGHVAGWNGFELLDWAKGRQHRIKEIIEVVPSEELKPVEVRGYNDIVVPAPVRRRRKVQINFVAIENRKHVFDNRFNVVVPPARVNREKWARENAITVCAHGQIGVIELKGDAAVNYRKANNVRGKVYMTFSFENA